MKSTDNDKRSTKDGPLGPSSSFLKRWAFLFAGILVIGIFSSVIGPWIVELPLMKPVNQVIQERGIEANLYDYTEIELFGDADFYMRHAMNGLAKDSSYFISIIVGAALFGLIVWIGYKFILD